MNPIKQRPLWDNTRKLISRSLLVASACCSPLIHAADETLVPEVEVMHWWGEGGDARAMRVISDEFEYRGGVWYDAAGEDAGEIINLAISRMAKGYSPTLMQWVSGWELSELRRLGLLNEISPEFLEQIESSYLDAILKQVSVDNQIVAVPVNVHSTNWIWYRPTNLEVDESIFADWDTLIDYAKTRKDSQRALLAVGNESWQQRLLFNNVLLGVAGREVYQRLFFDLNVHVLESQAFNQAITTFLALKPFSNSFGTGEWRQQVLAVASGQALAISMGDSAKSEFRKLGLKAGRNMKCLPAPGTQGEIVLTVDAFVLGQVFSEEELAGQQLFLDIVTDQSINETFNYLKGSVPPLRSADFSSLDECSQTAFSVINNGNSTVKPFESVGDRIFLTKIENLIQQLWTEEPDIDSWKAELKKLFIDEQRQRRTRIGSFYP